MQSSLALAGVMLPEAWQMSGEHMPLQLLLGTYSFSMCLLLSLA